MVSTGGLKSGHCGRMAAAAAAQGSLGLGELETVLTRGEAETPPGES